MLKHIPENSVFELYRGGNKAWELYEQGILKIEDIEDDFPLTHFQHLQRKGLRNQEQYINKEAIKNMISSWQFPCISFDFETVFLLFLFWTEQYSFVYFRRRWTKEFLAH